MISAVDTNILLDILKDDPNHGSSSRNILTSAYDQGGIIISEVVYAELAPKFETREDLDAVLVSINIRAVVGGMDAAFLAGKKWAAYRKAGGTRERVLADFLIGAHALIHSERLLTRDRGFYKTYFPELKLLGSE